MSHMIQALECRMLMSVTADTVTADFAAVKTAISAFPVARTAQEAGINNTITDIAAELKVVTTPPIRAANTRLIAKLRVAGAIGKVHLRVDENILLAVARVQSTATARLGQARIAHRANDHIRFVLTRFVFNLEANASKRLTTLQNAQAAFETGFNAIADQIGATNPSIQGAVSTGESNLATLGTDAGAAANQVGVAVGQLVSDLLPLVSG